MVMSRSQARSVFFFKQKTAYEMRISDWSSDVCSSDLGHRAEIAEPLAKLFQAGRPRIERKIGGVVGDEGLEYFETDIAKDALDRKSVVEGTSVSGRVDLGGRRIIKKKIMIQYISDIAAV